MTHDFRTTGRYSGLCDSNSLICLAVKWSFPVFFIRVITALLFIIAGSTLVKAGDTGIDFSRDIRPILANYCFKCHGPDEAVREADLRLDSARWAYADRGGSQAVKPGDPDASTLIFRINSHDPDEQMPPPDSGLSLSENQKSLLHRWIQSGARFQQHWSFRPIIRPAVPNPEPGSHPIDSFVQHRLKTDGLTLAQEADRHTLIRRVYLDVIGLPPEAAEIELFLNDESPGAYERMVDYVLQSPHYGEKWARHWLDQARYADTNGYTIDSPRSMWPWRDWVIRAINMDMPFDQFTIEQLAGDLLPSPTRNQLIATGFHRNTLINGEGGTDDEQFRNESVVDRVNTTGAVWLGLTVGCAQCHNHKYDPLTQQEYYQLFAFFNSTEDVNTTNPTISLPTAQQKKRLSALIDAATAAVQALTHFDESHPAGERTDAQTTLRTELEKTIQEANDLKAQFEKLIPTTMVMRRTKEPRVSHVLVRGDFLRKGDVVLPDSPSFLPAMSPADNDSRNRLALARWLVHEDNPLTARVTVNRTWMQLFGQGLVETENDFGLQGTSPTHPALLDWLSVFFMENEWSKRSLIRMILTSATYRQSSVMRPSTDRIDPLNSLLSRQSRVRVDAEIIRDLTLAASGILHPVIGGPGVYPPQPDGVYAFTQRKADWPTSQGPDRYRRGMYTFFMRSAPHPMLTTFDTPFFNTSCTRRVRSNTPLQSLTMANDKAFIEATQAFAARLVETHNYDYDRITLAWHLCLSRPPTDKEQRRVMRFVKAARRDLAQTPSESAAITGTVQNGNSVERAVWTLVARTLFNLDEFITRE